MILENDLNAVKKFLFWLTWDQYNKTIFAVIELLLQDFDALCEMLVIFQA